MGAVAQVHLDTAVLRHTLFGDAHGGAHHLEACHDGPEQLLRVVGYLYQAAVHAKTQAHAVFHGLDVNIGGAHLMRIVEHVVHQFNDGAFGVALGVLLLLWVVLVQRLHQQRLSRHKEAHIAAQELRQTVHCLHVEWVADGNL